MIEQAYYILGRVLSLTRFPERTAGIPPLFPKEKNGWNRIVKTGSDNLILPSFYLALEKNNLLEHLPEDLVIYLKEIFSLNQERNEKILAESRSINRELKEEGISCVFMKGVANIMDNLYHDDGERMLYDIDILVEEEKMVAAAQMLENNGYKSVKEFNPHALSSTMHYPLLVKDGNPAGVEIHRMPTQYLYTKLLSVADVFSEQMSSTRFPEIMVMSNRHKVMHNFIHAQLMHNGHYHAGVSIRNLYDLLLLGQRDDLLKTFAGLKRFPKQSFAYLKLMNKVFATDETRNTLRSGLTVKFFLWRHRQVLRMGGKTLHNYHLGLMILQKYLILPVRTLWNPLARNYVFSRLFDRNWYGRHFYAMKRRIFRGK
jgi:hypothetical protein